MKDKNTRILLFLKAPTPGTVKTRLALATSIGTATDVYRFLVKKQIAQLEGPWALEIHYAPVEATQQMRDWLGDTMEFHPQFNGTLGERLEHAVHSAFSRGARQILCIGGDCPALTSVHCDQAFQRMREGTDLILGPSTDGGYYLLGLKQPTPEIFRDIPWSTGETLHTTLDRAKALDLSVHQLETLYDIDELPELERAINEGLLPQNLI